MTKQSGNGRIEIEHDRVGTIALAEEDLLRFEGLPGFPDARRFALLDHREGSCFAWLACIDDPTLAFAVVDPFELYADYAPTLSVEDLALVGAAEPAEVCLLAIASLGGCPPSANLAAPLLVHAGTRRSTQLMLSDPRWPLRAEIPSAPRAPNAPRSSGRVALSALSRAQTESNPHT